MTAAAKLPAVIASRYLPVRVIGRGGMGVVYEVVHAHTGEHLALKVLLAGGAAPITDLRRFQREARAPAQIKSEHVVHVLDADTAPELDNAPFLVMELLEGVDLEQAAALATPGPATVVEWLQQIAPALDKAHRMGIIHRDLKPENLFLANQEARPPLLKILDFGIAKLTEEDSTATASGQILGTPRYMAPEQATQSAKVTGATDLYALGLVAYRLLTGESYYRGPMMSVLAELLHGVPSAPSARHPQLGAGFDAWFLQACHREPERRFASASEQMEALARALGVPCLQHAAEPEFSSFTPAADATSSPSVTDAPPVASQGLRSKKRLVALVGATLAFLAAIVAYRAFSAQEGTRLDTQHATLLGSPQLNVGHGASAGLAVEPAPAPASLSAAPLVEATPPIPSEAPRTTPPAAAPASMAAPAPRRKAVKAPAAVTSASSVSAPDPYRDQK
ncbi:MAG TPA: serine/threonine-protein kinase [Polyangiaceae bacterium]|nr:serine/threonine-protein kinase [Polyangiaceae bacterium]